jgi:hypothetical protein
MVGKTELVFPTNEAAQFVLLKNPDGTDVSGGANGISVDVLAGLGTPRSIAVGASSVNVALTATCRRFSIYATVATFYAVGVGAQTATTSSHFIGPGERLDFDCAANTQIAALQVTSGGVLYISELVPA